MLMADDGVYVDLRQHGDMTVTIVFDDESSEPIETNVVNEMLALMDFDFQKIRHIVDLLRELVSFDHDPDAECPIRYRKETKDGDSVRKSYKQLMKELPKINMVLAALVRMSVETRCSTYFKPETVDYQRDNQIVQCLHEPMHAQFDLFCIMERLCNNSTYGDLTKTEATYEITQLYDDQEKKMVYRFRSPHDYYNFLIMQFVMLKPAVQRCEYCQKYFIPKTRKTTKYCDRPQWNGKTCKQVAPKAKHKALAESDDVIQTYDRTKTKVYRRYERVDHLDPAERYPFYLDYCAWNEKATAARDAYLRGELSAEDALAVIKSMD